MFPRLNEKGLSLLEIIVVLGALAVVAVALAQVGLLFRRNVSANLFNIRANALVVETIEALRFVKENNWKDLGDLTPGAKYFLSVSKSPNKWDVVGVDPGKIDGVFSRDFAVRQIYRDAVTGQIVSSGGALDDQTMLVEINVDWNDRGRDKSVRMQTYLSNH